MLQETVTDPATGEIQKRVVYALGLDQITQTTTAYSGGQPQSSETLVFNADGHGSTRLLTDLAGAILTLAGIRQLFSYDAYGNAIGFNPAQAATAFLYSGEQFDASLGLQYLRARYYDPATGRFNRLDPFFGNLNDPQSLHKYLYTHGDPVNGIDPSGLFSCSETLSALRITVQNFAKYHPYVFSAIVGSAVSAGDAALRGEDYAGVFKEALKGGLIAFAIGPVFFIRLTRPVLLLARELLGVGLTAATLIGVADAIEQDNVALAIYRGALSFTAFLTFFNAPGDTLHSPGRPGNDITKALDRHVALVLRNRGWKVTHGAGLPQEYLPPLKAGERGNYPDLTATKGDRILRVETFSTLADGVTPTPEEAAKAALIRLKRPGDHLLLIPKRE